MAESTAIDAQDTLFEVENASNAFIAIPNVRTFSDFAGGEASDVDVTHLQSAAKEYRSGLVDNGVFTLELDYNRDEAGHERLRALQAARTVEQFRITFSDGSIATFDGLVKRFSISGGVDDVLRASVSIRITGAVAIAAAP